MRTIEQILRALPGNVESFKRSSETNITSGQLPEELGRGIDLGQLIMRDVGRIVGHLTFVQTRLEESNEG
jgi:hypothetical protein